MNQINPTNSIHDSLLSNVESLEYFVPELMLCGFMIVLILTDIITKNIGVVRFLAFVGLVTCFVEVITEAGCVEVCHKPGQLLFNGLMMFRADYTMVKLIALGGAILAIIFPIFRTQILKAEKKEYFILIYAIVLGSMLLGYSQSWIMVYILLELISLSSYMIVALERTKQSSEAGLKYFLFGAFSSAIMLFGISLIYVSVGELGLQEFTFQLLNTEDPILLTGIALAFAGILFKISGFPFHIWTPDVYQGGYTPVVAFFSLVPKAASMYLLWGLFPQSVGKNTELIVAFIGSIALITMFIGNLAALRQTNIKRMIGYSSIAHTGFMLLAVVAQLELEYLMFYLIIYGLANYALFFSSEVVAENDDYSLTRFKGLGKTSVTFSVLLVVSLISLTGLPPAAGFWGKLFLFSGLYEHLGQGDFIYVLMLLGILNAVLGLFYYIRIPYFMFFKSDVEKSGKIGVGVHHKIFLILLTIPLVVYFLKPNWLLQLFI